LKQNTCLCMVQPSVQLIKGAPYKWTMYLLACLLT